MAATSYEEECKAFKAKKKESSSFSEHSNPLYWQGLTCFQLPKEKCLSDTAPMSQRKMCNGEFGVDRQSIDNWDSLPYMLLSFHVYIYTLIHYIAVWSRSFYVYFLIDGYIYIYMHINFLSSLRISQKPTWDNDLSVCRKQAEELPDLRPVGFRDVYRTPINRWWRSLVTGWILWHIQLYTKVDKEDSGDQRTNVLMQIDVAAGDWKSGPYVPQ